MNATEAFRTASASHPPEEGLSGHIVLVGLGKIGTRVLVRLCTTAHEVVVVERDPHARGEPLAREPGVPLLLEDATGPGVLGLARIRHGRALLITARTCRSISAAAKDGAAGADTLRLRVRASG
jgi:uncharacterized protein YbjT (DUF2867 family)